MLKDLNLGGPHVVTTSWLVRPGAVIAFLDRKYSFGWLTAAQLSWPKGLLLCCAVVRSTTPCWGMPTNTHPTSPKTVCHIGSDSQAGHWHNNQHLEHADRGTQQAMATKRSSGAKPAPTPQKQQGTSSLHALVLDPRHAFSELSSTNQSASVFTPLQVHDVDVLSGAASAQGYTLPQNLGKHQHQRAACLVV